MTPLVRQKMWWMLVMISLGHSTILIDGIHGWPTPSEGTWEEMFPDQDFDYLSKNDFPIEQIIAQGTVMEENFSLSFNVPVGFEMLYLRYELSDPDIMTQHPWITIINPNGVYEESSFIGQAHVENPIAGTWEIQIYSWGSFPITYEIGLGQDFYHSEMLSNYETVVQMVENTFALFVGYNPTLSDYEYEQLTQYFDSGGGYLYFRESDGMMAEKPVIRLYSQKSMDVDVLLDFPGRPTYLNPDTDFEVVDHSSLIRWQDIHLTENRATEILYEGKFPDRLNYVTGIDNGTSVTVENQSPVDIRDIHLLKFDGIEFTYGYYPGLQAGGTGNGELSQRFKPSELTHLLVDKMITEGVQEGMYPDESSSFFHKYQWVNRWVYRAIRSGELCAIYHFSESFYDELIPLTISPQPEETARIMWVFSENLPQSQIGMPFFPVDTESSHPDTVPTDELVYHEYGVIEEKYATFDREVTFLGIHFYDGFIIDETDNYLGDSWSPVFHVFGDDPNVDFLSSNVESVQGFMSTGLSLESPDSGFYILMGDEDSYTDWPQEFPPGSFPPAAAGKYMGNGKLIGIADRQIVSDYLDNIQFISNCLDWLGSPGGLKGDVNTDGAVDILDVVMVVNFILLISDPSSYQSWAGDMNDDGELNVLDVVRIVNVIMGTDPLPQACMLEPEVGPCDGICPIYFYNPQTEQCEMFTWGCCEGVVPFETLEECTMECED